MSWSAGMNLLADVWEQVEHFIPSDERAAIAKILVEQFRDNDANDYSSLEDNDVLHTAIKEILDEEGEDVAEYEED